MRSDQYIGLSARGLKMLCDARERNSVKVNVTTTKKYPDGRIETSSSDIYEVQVTEGVCGKFSGMFDKEYELHDFTFGDGTYLAEGLQASPWSSGPMFFIALKDKNGEWIQETLWMDGEMRDY